MTRYAGATLTRDRAVRTAAALGRAYLKLLIVSAATILGALAVGSIWWALSTGPELAGAAIGAIGSGIAWVAYARIQRDIRHDRRRLTSVVTSPSVAFDLSLAARVCRVDPSEARHVWQSDERSRYDFHDLTMTCLAASFGRRGVDVAEFTRLWRAVPTADRAVDLAIRIVADERPQRALATTLNSWQFKYREHLQGGQRWFEIHEMAPFAEKDLRRIVARFALESLTLTLSTIGDGVASSDEEAISRVLHAARAVRSDLQAVAAP